MTRDQSRDTLVIGGLGGSLGICAALLRQTVGPGRSLTRRMPGSQHGMALGEVQRLDTQGRPAQQGPNSGGQGHLEPG